MSVRRVMDPCSVCGFSALERGGVLGVDSSETECPRCLAQHAVDDAGRIEFTYDLPGKPLASELWDRDA